MPVHLRSDAEQAKLEPGAYIQTGERPTAKLYYVQAFVRTGLTSGMLHCIHITKHSETECRLTTKEVTEARLVKAAPELTLPAGMEAA